jgi:hypothetical protein
MYKQRILITVLGALVFTSCRESRIPVMKTGETNPMQGNESFSGHTSVEVPMYTWS